MDDKFNENENLRLLDEIMRPLEEIIVVSSHPNTENPKASTYSDVDDFVETPQMAKDYKELRDSQSLEKPVDGGYGYVIIFIGFLIQFVAIGFINNIGFWKSLWELEFPKEASIVGLVCTTVFGLMFFLAPLAAFLAENVGCRFLALTGCLICSVSMLTSSFVGSAWGLFALFGIGFGVGISFLFFASIMIIPSYFKVLRPMANGMVTSGSGIGALVVVLILEAASKYHDWRVLMRVSSAVFSFLVIPVIFLIPRSIEYCPFNFILAPFDKKGYARFSKFILTFGRSFYGMMTSCICRNPQFSMLLIGFVVFMLGYMAPFLFLNSYAASLIPSTNNGTMNIVPSSMPQNSKSYSSTFDKYLASMLIGIFCIFSSMSKIASGIICAKLRLKPCIIIPVSFFVMGISYIITPFIKSVSALLSVVIFGGICEGAYIALVVASVEEVNGDTQLNAAVGILYAIKALPITFSGFLLSFIFSASGESYTTTFVISGVFVIAGGLIITLLYALPKVKISVFPETSESNIQILSKSDTGLQTNSDIAVDTGAGDVYQA